MTLPVPATHAAFLYVFEGAAEAGGRPVPAGMAGVLGDGNEVTITAGPADVLLAWRS